MLLRRLSAVAVGAWLVTCLIAGPAARGHEGHEDHGAADTSHAEGHEAPGHGTDVHGDGQEHGGSHGAEASTTAMNPLSIDPDLAICTAIVFVLMLIVLRIFAWKPIMEGLEKREQVVANNIEEAKRSAEQAAEQLRQYEAKLAAAADEAREIVAEARRDAEALAEKMRLQAQEDAKRERDRAVADIDAAKGLALEEVAKRGADLAVSLAANIVRREVNRSDHDRLITEALEKMPSNN